MDLSKPVSSWETELYSIKGIENRINYLEETIILDLNDSWDGYLNKKMEYINENMHLEDSIADPGVMRLHTINERKIKDYDKRAKELEIEIERARNYLYSFYSWIENKHLLNQDPPKTVKKSIGESKLTMDQISLLAFYLRRKRIVSPGIENKQLGEAFSIITQFSKGQISKTIVLDNQEPFKITSKETDFAEIIKNLKELINTIEADKVKYKTDGEIK